MSKHLLSHLENELHQLKIEGLFKEEHVITSPQSTLITLEEGGEVLNLAANNYLGLANNSEIIETAKKSFSQFGFGLASVRFICGTQSIHKKLEGMLSAFLETEDTILYSSCFDANGGVFEALLNEQDAVISDALNHASIIDGIRLSKAKRYRYKNNDMEDLEKQLKDAKDARFRLIVTDGVFSMDGIIANLKRITELAETYDALVMVDDCHATGFLGKKGKGSIEFCQVLGKVDIITSTLGKALGGASGGFVSGKKEIVAWLRQRSRPYLFSNALAPSIAAASCHVLELVKQGDDKRQQLEENSQFFRREMEKRGFELGGNGHPIIPVMIGDAVKASLFSKALLEEGIFAISFSYPVVPLGKARIRTQMSAAHTKDQLEKAVLAFEKVGQKLGIINPSRSIS